MTFTKEDLRDIAYRGSYDDLERELALQLLDSMEQEPVADVVAWSSPTEERTCDIRWRRHDVKPGPLYAAPPAPVVPDFDTLRLAFEAVERESEHGFNLHKYGVVYADEATQARWESWLACRAAILQGAEPVSMDYTLPLDYLQGQKDGLEWAAQMAEANHPETGDWLYDDPLELAKAIRKGPDMPEAAGNTPVIPDGYALVPVEMTDEIGEVIAREARCCGGIALDIYDAILLAAAPQQEVK